MSQILDDEKKARRAETSRRNGARSRGPRTDQGKFISSRNAIKHGCYSVAHALLDEDPAEVARLRQRWFDLKRPRNIEEEMLVEETFQGHLAARRYHRALGRHLIMQQEQQLLNWEANQANEARTVAEALVTGRAENAEASLAHLRSFGAGVVYLLDEHERLAA